MERLPLMVRARLRKRWRWTPTAVALLVSACRQAPAQEEPAFRVDVRLVNVVATVKNPHDAPVGDLEKEDFTVLAGGIPQRISIFERQTDRPLSVALLFDASASVAKELKFAREAAMRFIRSLLGGGANPGDRIAIYRFSHDVEEILGFAASLERLEKAVQSIQISGGTSVYDALYLAARRLEGRQGRKVIVIITDGGDTTSSTTFHQALEAAQLADAVIYSIIVVPITSDAGRNLGGENALRTMSASTGGLAFMQYSDQDMDRTFRAIERDLRIQYVIGFYSQGLPTTKERFRNRAAGEPAGSTGTGPERLLSGTVAIQTAIMDDIVDADAGKECSEGLRGALQKGTPKNHGSDAKVDDQPGDVHQGSHKRGGSTGRIEPQAPQNEREH